MSHQIEELGEEYIQFLYKENVFNELIPYLFMDIESTGKSSGQKNQVLPIKWLEAKIQRIRKVAIESSRSLSL